MSSTTPIQIATYRTAEIYSLYINGNYGYEASIHAVLGTTAFPFHNSLRDLLAQIDRDAPSISPPILHFLSKKDFDDAFAWGDITNYPQGVIYVSDLQIEYSDGTTTVIYKLPTQVTPEPPNPPPSPPPTPPSPAYSNLTITVQGQGTTGPSAGNYPNTSLKGDNLAVIATPSAGWLYSKMQRNGVDWTTANPGQFLNLSATENIEVIFVQSAAKPCPYKTRFPTVNSFLCRIWTRMQ